MQVRRVDAGGLTFEVAEAGAANTRRVLLLHGFTGAKDDFVEAVDRLADAGWHAVAPDLRGHGNSAKPDSEDAYSLDVLAGDVWALADALGWNRLVLLGLSMGGMIAQVAALRHPERLDGLVVVDTIPGARLVVVPDAGHAPHVENTEAWWDPLISFLKEVP